MSHFYDDIKKINLPELPKDQYYIYIIENSPAGNIKIGRSSNIKKRLQSLSGSNNGGNHIIRAYVSDATYLYSLEKNMHNHFHDMRIKGTEWFDGTKLSFEEAAFYLNDLFLSPGYEKCNEIRKNFNEMQRTKNLEIQKPKEEEIEFEID